MIVPTGKVNDVPLVIAQLLISTAAAEGLWSSMNSRPVFSGTPAPGRYMISLITTCAGAGETAAKTASRARMGPRRRFMVTGRRAANVVASLSAARHQSLSRRRGKARRHHLLQREDAN